MRLSGVLTTVLLLAAPVAAGAQGHGGMAGGHGGAVAVAAAHGGPGWGHAGAWHGAGFHGPDFGHGFGPGFGHGFDHDHFFHGRFHDHGFVWGWYPYWGWPDCGADGDSCNWGDESDPGAPSDDYGYTEGPPPPEASCGGWVRRGGRYAWAPNACSDPPPADPPRHEVASNECSDWVWRTDLHHSVCKRAAHAAG